MINATSEGLIILLKVLPNSSKNQIVSWENEELKIKIQAPPEEGKANKELIQFLSKLLKVSKSNIFILSGETNRHKKIKIKNLSSEKFSSLVFPSKS